jgi:chaperone modulatory protein CbpM
VALACDLHYRMGLDHASLPVILSLIDQLHDARRNLRALTRAVCEQSDEVQDAISRHVAKARANQQSEQGPPQAD